MKIRTIPSVYSKPQLKAYLKRIHWTGEDPKPTLECLTQLMRRHLCAIPFSNAFIVYEDKYTDYDPLNLYERIVTQKGGWFCFGQNGLFKEILRGFGFRCYSGLARVNPNFHQNEEWDLMGLNHFTIFVAFNEDPNLSDEDHLYLVDVGFGGANITVPLPIYSGSSAGGALDEMHTIRIRSHPRSSMESADSDLFSYSTLPAFGNELVLEFLVTGTHNWRTMYSFSTVESFQEDYESLHFSSCHLLQLFTKNVIMALYVDAGEDRPLGRLTIFNDYFKRRVPGEEEQRIKFRDEKHRIQVIKEVFGLGDLPDNAEENITKRGLAITCRDPDTD